MTVPLLAPLAQFGLGLGAGIGIGLVHFASLWWNARLFATGGSAPKALAVQLVRFGVLVAVFAGLAKLGAPALMAGALGLLAARHLVLRRVGAAG